jgi:iron complex transport system ATP-binding protein
MLTFSKLTVGYTHGAREERLFEDVTLQLTAGELVCFMGPNGIGKSTLLRTLAGLHPPLSGELPTVSPADVAIVLTEKIQTPHLTVRELIAYGRYPYLDWHTTLRTDDQLIIERCLKQVRMEHLGDRSLSELSDGQLQMAMIGRALAQATPVLLLDEPTAHLDLNNRVEIMNLLRTLARKEGKAIVIATHELDLALQTADRIWLASGKGIVQGIPEELVLNGAFDYVFQLKGFDLKTGKVRHEPYRQQKIRLEGEGYQYLWTKNALEREGFEVNPSAPDQISIDGKEWLFRGRTYVTLEALIRALS